MDLQTFLIPIVLLTFSGSNSALESSIPSVLNAEQSPADFTGINLEWIYIRNNVDFYLVTNKASYHVPSRSRYKYIEVTGGSENERNIQIHGNTYYLGVNTEGLLENANFDAAARCFVPVPLESSPDKFYLHSCNQNLPLVTPMTHPPFEFYVQTRYPDETPAIFRLAPYIFNVTQFYDGKRENLKKTLELIRDIDPLVRDLAYAELVSLMFNLGHLIGKDVFYLGNSVFVNTGADSLAFKLLPQIVQTIIAGGPLRLIYSHLEIENMLMKGPRTYDQPDYVLPYTFTSGFGGETWAITYGINEQLRHASSAFQLTTTVTNTKTYQFQLHLKADHQSIELHTDRVNSGYYDPLEPKRYTSNPNGYIFVNEGKSVNTSFIVLPYVINVTEMYAGLRENIIKTAEFIQNNLTDVDRALPYEQLLSDMSENGHIEGTEIFYLGQYILADLGNSSVTFQLLPPTVQLVLSGETISLALEKDGQYPIKYTWASDNHENIHPITFSYSTANSRFAITYSEDFQWSVPTTGSSRKLKNVKSMSKEYLFDVYLAADLQGIQVRCWSTSAIYGPLRTLENIPEFYFECYTNNSGGDFFSVKVFV